MKTWQKLRNHPELWEQYFLRERVYASVRAFFSAEQFHEVEAPTLVAYPPAESYIDIFETTLLDRQRNASSAYLSTSPELAIKKLLVAGIGDCFSIAKAFRNMETASNLHNPEFSILEWYRVGVSYEHIMDDCERLFLAILTALGKSVETLSYQSVEVSLTTPWERITVKEAFERYANIQFDEFLDHETARDIAKSKGYHIEDHRSWEEIYNQLYINEVEPHLGKKCPTIIYEFPSELAALARHKPGDPRYAERFEVYIAGVELADCYRELTDWQEQKRRFDEQVDIVKRKGYTTYAYDMDFIDALKEGLPECSGIALGLDRLLMLLADVKSIRDVMFFPGVEEFESFR